MICACIYNNSLSDHCKTKTTTNDAGSLGRVDITEADYAEGQFYSTWGYPLIQCEARDTRLIDGWWDSTERLGVVNLTHLCMHHPPRIYFFLLSLSIDYSWTRRSGMGCWEAREIPRNLPLSVLATRCLGWCCYRWPTADRQRAADLYSLPG